MKHKAERPLIIGIAGGSGCGKTFLARQIVAALGDHKVATISMDGYFRTEISDPSAAHDVNFDHPSHLDIRALIQDLKHLRDGRAVEVPSYDFASMRQTSKSAVIEPRSVIVVEGLFILAEPVVSLCDLTCFLDVAADERLLGRILRDISERAALTEHVIDRYQRFVRPGYRIFVEPTMQNADVVVDFTFHRAMFTQLLIGLIRRYVDEQQDLDEFVRALRIEGFRKDAGFGECYMSMTTDIFKLAEAYPETAQMRKPDRSLRSPAAETLGHRPPGA